MVAGGARSAEPPDDPLFSHALRSVAVNDLQRLLDAQSRRAAGVVRAAIVRRNPDGSYRVRNVATGSERDVEKASAGDEYAPGEYVTVGSPFNARAVLGARDVILSRSRQQRGVSETAPESAEQTITTPAIFAIDPDPVELEAGGSAVAATLHGVAFAGLVPGYGDPGISNATPPIVAPNLMSLNLAAASDVEVGLYDLSVGSAVRRDAIRVVAAPPPDADWSNRETRVDAWSAYELPDGSYYVRFLMRYRLVGGTEWIEDTTYAGPATLRSAARFVPSGWAGPYDAATAPPDWTLPVGAASFVGGEVELTFPPQDGAVAAAVYLFANLPPGGGSVSATAVIGSLGDPPEPPPP